MTTSTDHLKSSQSTTGSVSFETSQGIEFQATILKAAHRQLVIEIYAQIAILRVSDVLTNFRVLIEDSVVYLGRALVSNTIHTGAMVVCEVELAEPGLAIVPLASTGAPVNAIKERFVGFLERWQVQYHVRPEFKQVIGDMQSFLTDLRMWLDQVELEIRSSPSGDRSQLEQAVLREIEEPAIRSIDAFIDRFEAMVATFEDNLHPAHRAYLRRHLYPLLLCSPFAYRTIQKPLGYAGDYEMVDMMMRSPYEGSTLFAKVVNTWLLAQAPARAHRNRAECLAQKLLQEGLRLKSQGRIGRVYNLGCGPASEIQLLLRKSPIADQLEFTLLDFNEETLRHTHLTLEGLKRSSGRSAQIQLLKRSVQQVLKDAAKPSYRTVGPRYDVVYCAGLFDYLSDAVCKRLMDALYDLLAPGGLLVATNVADAMNSVRPFRHSMEYILDWFLLYRNGPSFVSLAPQHAPRDQCVVVSENLGVNVFLEIRKPT